jgi:hypothetical protein
MKREIHLKSQKSNLKNTNHKLEKPHHSSCIKEEKMGLNQNNKVDKKTLLMNNR